MSLTNEQIAELRNTDWSKYSMVPVRSIYDLLDDLAEARAAREKMPCGHWKARWVECQRIDASEPARITQGYCLDCRALETATLEKEQYVAQHIKGGATDGCQCEPCISARGLIETALAAFRERAAKHIMSVADDPCFSYGENVRHLLHEIAATICTLPLTEAK